jgi:hypothetical protein
MQSITKQTFNCEQCNKSFASKGNLNHHTRTIHDNTMSFYCDKCEKVFNQNGNLKLHLKTVHENIRTFNCGQCSKSFGMKQQLEQHLRCHVAGTTKLIPKGEAKIIKMLDLMKIEYRHDESFKGLRGIKGVLRFDFIIKTLSHDYVFIEFDGQGHTRAVQFGGRSIERSIKAYEDQLANDAIKNAYCEMNSFEILRIPYNRIADVNELVIDFVLKNNVI